MLITICYSVLTWMQSRQRSEITGWLEEYLLKSDPPCSLVFIRGEAALTSSSSNSSGLLGPQHYYNQGGPEIAERPSSASSFYYSANNDSLYSR